MENGIFREKSLEKIKSPENLDDYICVSNPGLWLLLVSIVLLLVGACVWSVFGHIDSTVNTAVHVEQGNAICYVDDEDIAKVKTGMTVKFADFQATLTEIGESGELGYSCTLTAQDELDDGFYEGRIVINTFKPISFILN